MLNNPIGTPIFQNNVYHDLTIHRPHETLKQVGEYEVTVSHTPSPQQEPNDAAGLTQPLPINILKGDNILQPCVFVKHSTII